MSAPSSSLFDSLPARPPTPPRDFAKAIDDAISFLDDSNEVEQLIAKAANPQCDLNASEVTPSSSQDITSLSTLAKKVGFSPNPVYFKISQPDQSSSPGARLSKRSPSTAKDAKPLKSILKPSYAPPPSPEDLESKLSHFSPAEPESFARMLQSVCKQLGGTSRSVRLDAYLTLNGTLKKYENVPDTTAMLQKMRLLMQFLSRDIAWKDSGDKLDTQMVTQALKLTNAILFSRELSEALDDDFRHFLVDRSLVVIEEPDMPKQVVKSHMHLLCQQRFLPPIMNSGRADRILTALQSIEDRCSGNSIVSYRLMIYERLLDQQSPLMLSRARDWLEHIFHGMLSSVNDVRSRAIETCKKAGLCLGQQAHVSSMLCEIFETERDGQTYLDYLISRLLQMTSDKEHGYQVPRIWSAVILLFRSKRMPLDKWTSYQTWLSVITKCFNASNLTVRYEATLAWNRVVFATMPGAGTTKAQMNALRIPIIRALEKQSTDKSSKQFQEYVLATFYNLLHYGLRPGLSTEELDAAWDAFVEPVLSALVKSKGKGGHVACRVLGGLLNGNAGVWNRNAALEPTIIKPEDLPKLDPKWVRTRIARFLRLLEPIILQDVRRSSDDSRTMDATWQSLMQALADARIQEVRTTMEGKEAIALLIALFRRIWASCTPPIDLHRWLKRYAALLDVMMDGIGISSFTEDILATTTDDLIEVAPTPSHRPSKHHSAPMSPMVILLGQFYRCPAGLAPGDTYFSSAFTILERSLSCKATTGASLALLCRSLHTWTNICGLGEESPIRRELWIVVARAATRVLQADLKQTGMQDSQPPGYVLRSGMDIFARGLVFEHHLRLTSTLSGMYNTLIDSAKSKAVEGGVVYAVMEPLAKTLTDPTGQRHSNTMIHIATQMLERTSWPKTRQSLEQARKALWGVGVTPTKTTIFDPFEHVYRLIVSIMSEAYNAFGNSQYLDIEALQSFFNAVIHFLESSPIILRATALRKIQDGFVAWIEDSSQKTSSNEQITTLIQAGWQSITELLKPLPSKDSALLKALAPLFTAGFASPHGVIVNHTIVFWNQTFGAAESLDYPEKLESVLRARLADAEIDLPTFPEGDVDHVPATLPAFYDSQSSESTTLHPPKLFGTAARVLLSPAVQSRSIPNERTATKSSPLIRTLASPSPAKRAHRRSTSLTPKPRLRHDDSQIQFAPIDSSPLPPDDESQHLTEHQKEVKARQHLNAQLFPDLSSSPMAHSTALPTGLPKRLDFGSKDSPTKISGHFGTPTGLPDGNVLASDDMPSSPTPSSTKDASQGALDIDMDPEEDDDDLHDPPSSPPHANEDEAEEAARAHQATEIGDDKAMPEDISELPASQHIVDAGDQIQQHDDSVNADEIAAETDEMFSASEYPLNSTSPDEQVQLEIEVARDSQSTAIRTHVNEGTALDEASPDIATAGAEDDVTRIDDSFANADSPASSKANEANEANETSGKSPRGDKKRKRKASKDKPAKKRKQQSPTSRKSYIFGFAQQEDDDDIGDEIVLASSQPKSLPTAERVLTAAEEPVESTEPNDSDDEAIVVERSIIVKEEPEFVQPPIKRVRGRPRKSDTPNPSQSETVPTKKLKRKASQMSNASFERSQNSSSFVKDTQAPTKPKRRPGRPPHRDSISQTSQEGSRPGSSSGRAAVAVLVSPTSKPVQSQRAVPQTALTDQPKGETSAVEDRPVLTPRSILARLKDALSDFKGMIMGSQEEKQFDDVLFELRKETHAAARRGRDL